MDFAQRIIKLEQELRDINTNGKTSSSSLAVAEHEIDVQMQIVGYKVNYENDNCASEYAALIAMTPKDGKSMLTSCAIVEGAEFLTDRSVILVPITIDGNPAYEFRIQAGSPADLTIIQNGGSIAQMSFRLLLTGTSEFNTNIEYRKDH